MPLPCGDLIALDAIRARSKECAHVGDEGLRDLGRQFDGFGGHEAYAYRVIIAVHTVTLR